MSGAGGQPREAVIWAFRFLIGRDPASEEEIAFHSRHGSLDSLRTAFLESPEFRALHAAATGRKQAFGAPIFLLRPPEDPALPHLFAEPRLEAPVWQLCTASQFAEPAFEEIRSAMGLGRSLHRRAWEQAYLVAALATMGLIEPGRRAIGLGVGRERVPALLASRGVQVVVNAALPGAASPFAEPAPHEILARRIELAPPEVVDRDIFDAHASFANYATMPPAGLPAEFDACWSCSVIHLQDSLDAAMELVERSLGLLRPGGIAAHTLDINLSSNTETAEGPGFSLPRRRDLEALMRRLMEAGHEVAPLNLHPGLAEEDGVVDAPPYGTPHLKVVAGSYATTSLGLLIRKRA